MINVLPFNDATVTWCERYLLLEKSLNSIPKKEGKILYLSSHTWYVICSSVTGTLFSNFISKKNWEISWNKRWNTSLPLTQSITDRTIKVSNWVLLLIRVAVSGPFEFWALQCSLCMSLKVLGAWGRYWGGREHRMNLVRLSADSVSLTVNLKYTTCVQACLKCDQSPHHHGWLLKIYLWYLGYQGHHKSQRLASLVAWLTLMRTLLSVKRNVSMCKPFWWKLLLFVCFLLE